MPLYDYDCANCGRRFEVLRGVHADQPTVCPLCGGGPVKKAFAAPAIHFKGSGWAKKERRATASPGPSKSSRDGGSPGRDGGSSSGGDGGGSDGDRGSSGKGDGSTSGGDASSSSSGGSGPSSPTGDAPTSTKSSDGPSTTADKGT